MIQEHQSKMTDERSITCWPSDLVEKRGERRHFTFLPSSQQVL